VLRADRIDLAFAGNPALTGFSLSVARGEVVGLIGRNGAGKSTALRVLAGALRPDAGKATLDGLDVGEPAVRSRIGWLPEEPPLPDASTVSDAVRDAAALHAVPRAQRDGAVRAALLHAGVERVADRLCADLSTGARQRAGLAMALAGRPSVLLLDEPARGLDPIEAGALRQLLRELPEVAVVFSTHSLGDADDICDRVVVIAAGRVVHDGRPDAVRTSDLRVVATVRDLGAGEAALRGLAGVRGVRVERARLLIGLDRDVRPEVAAALAPAGLLELRSASAIEALLAEAPSR
jgi:ABC-2 type transport system ATP-binding protein